MVTQLYFNLFEVSLMNKDLVVSILSFVSAVVSAFVGAGNIAIAICFLLFAVLFGLGYLHKLSKPAVDLKDHPFWGRMNYYIKQKLPYVSIQDPLRKKLFIVTMTTKFEIAVEQMRQFIELDGFDSCKAKDLVINMVQLYETKWRTENIPEIFVEQFHRYNKPKIQSLIEYVEFICVSRFYDSDTDKKVAILDGMLHVFQWTIIDLERSDAAINGNLTRELRNLWSAGKF